MCFLLVKLKILLFKQCVIKIFKVRNIKKFDNHGTVNNLPGYERKVKIDVKCIRM